MGRSQQNVGVAGGCLSGYRDWCTDSQTTQETSYKSTLSSTYHDKELLYSTDDYSIVCDKLLEELEADLEKVSPKQMNVDLTDNSCVNHKEVFHINKMKMIQLTDNDNEAINISDNKNEPNRCHGEFFDNLLAIIEKAAQGLTL